MPLTYDQQKNLRSLIDNAGAGTYEEVRDELYDHLVQATEKRMVRGLSFTEAQREALEEMGGTKGLKNIDEGYQQAARQQVGRLFGSFVRLYIKSMRWMVPVSVVAAIKLYVPTQFYVWVSAGGVISFMIVMIVTLKRWNYGMPDRRVLGHPVSLRAFVVAERGRFVIPGMMIVNAFLTNNKPLDILSVNVLLLVFLLADYCLAFVAHAKKTWLEVA